MLQTLEIDWKEGQSKQFCQLRQFVEGVPEGDEYARNARLETPVAQDRERGNLPCRRQI
jgi:hypothetical protein